MPGRAGLRMLVWISAAGLAGAGWFGWLIYRDYDWVSFDWFGGLASAQRRGIPFSQPNADTYRADKQIVELKDIDLLGRTNTTWSRADDLQRVHSKDQEKENSTANQRIHYEKGESNTILQVPTVYPDEQPDEDFVVVGSAQTPTQKLEPKAHPTDDEDFVVVPTINPVAGVSPFLATTDEDFVVVPDDHLDNTSSGLPEVDLADYVGSWTPIVPKIAALISHELWPQLRAYLESLPQFGDSNLERVVNALAKDAGLGGTNPDGVGESQKEDRPAEGFAFYASLFDELTQATELDKVDQVG